MTTEFPCTIAYDFTLKRPGCAIVQSALGATISSDQLGRFPGWLTAPTPDMRLATLHTQAELEAAAAITKEGE